MNDPVPSWKVRPYDVESEFRHPVLNFLIWVVDVILMLAIMIGFCALMLLIIHIWQSIF